jgi:cobalt-zinc-cadmium efflux system outer membrane protein
MILALALGIPSYPAADDAPPTDLATLLEQAETYNPEILASQSRVGAMTHLPSQVEALPDPLVSVSYTNESLNSITLGTDPMSNLTFSWLQDLPYPGKRRLAGELARSEVDVAARTVEVIKLQVRSEVKDAYAELYRIDRTTAILHESRKLLESLRDAVRARQESGEGILENTLKAETELTQIDVELAGLAQERRSTEAALGALIGASKIARLGPALAAPECRIPDADQAEAAAAERSPQLAVLRAAEKRDENRVNLAKRNLKPDFMWGAGYSYRGSLDPMVRGVFGIRLPLYRNRKQQEAVTQSEFDLQAAGKDLESRNTTLLAEVRELLSHADRATEQMRLIGEGTVPLARSTFDSAAAAYSAGRAEFVTLIEDFRSMLSYEKDFEVKHAEKIKALAALEALTGGEYVVPPGVGGTEGATHD